jgi:poly [ADP-ribose] polymerase 2/3/4
MSRYTKLVMVTGENNNKYYEMKEVNGIIDITYGRVDSTAVKTTGILSKWDSIVASKVKKGYKDVTEMVSVKEDTTPVKTDDKYSPISDADVDVFIELMRRYTDNLVKNTYSVKAVNVSQKQVDKAQEILDHINVYLNQKYAIKDVNDLLLELYMVIPRFMGNVRNNLLPHIDIAKTLVQEQDNLDAMAAQVKMLKPTKTVAKLSKKTTTFLDKLGISMKKIKDYSPIDHITSQLKGHKINGVYEIEKNAEDVIFSNWVKDAKNKETRLLIHGTRCTSVIPILEQGLKIRPVGNFQFSGKAYGDGNYFSEVTQKSLGYTGYDSDIILFVYEVHTGNPFKYAGWYRGNSFTLNYKELSSRGFDSTHVSAGNGLLNSEIIAYREEQSRVKYIIHLKR